jgi:hypothetical protein
MKELLFGIKEKSWVKTKLKTEPRRAGPRFLEAKICRRG